MLNDMQALSGVWGNVDPTEESHIQKAMIEQNKKKFAKFKNLNNK